MKQKQLLKVYSDEKQRVFCSYCDVGDGEETDSWYEIENPTGIEISQKYLPCCLYKVGVVVGWKEEKEDFRE